MAKERLKERTLADMDTAQFIPLHDIAFDCITGGGVPLGCIIEFYGNNSCGKTTLAFEAIDAFLDAFPNKNAYYYNFERSIDKFYVRNLLKGDDEKAKRFKILDPDYLEEGMDHLLEVMEMDTASICVVDSLAAMSPKDEGDKALDKAQVGGFKAKLMAEVCRKIGTQFGRGSKTTIIFINHVNPVLGGFSFIQQQETPGGKAVKFWASLRVELSILGRLDREETIFGSSKKEKVAYGNIVKLKVEKNKFFPPYKRGIIYVILGKGLNRALSIIDYGVNIGVIGVQNSQMYYLVGKEDQKVRGKEKFAEKINSNKNLFDYLYKRINNYVEQEREKAKNPNVDRLSTGADYTLAAGEAQEDSNSDSIHSDIQDEFSRYSDVEDNGGGDEIEDSQAIMIDE